MAVKTWFPVYDKSAKWDKAKVFPELNFQGTLVVRFLEQWGLVAGKPGDEDKSGRRGIALLSPAEVVDRAFDIAQLTALRLEQSGWVRDTSEASLEEVEGISARAIEKSA